MNTLQPTSMVPTGAGSISVGGQSVGFLSKAQMDNLVNQVTNMIKVVDESMPAPLEMESEKRPMLFDSVCANDSDALFDLYGYGAKPLRSSNFQPWSTPFKIVAVDGECRDVVLHACSDNVEILLLEGTAQLELEVEAYGDRRYLDLQVDEEVRTSGTVVVRVQPGEEAVFSVSRLGENCSDDDYDDDSSDEVETNYACRCAFCLSKDA